MVQAVGGSSPLAHLFGKASISGAFCWAGWSKTGASAAVVPLRCTTWAEFGGALARAVPPHGLALADEMIASSSRRPGLGAGRSQGSNPVSPTDERPGKKGYSFRLSFPQKCREGIKGASNARAHEPGITALGSRAAFEGDKAAAGRRRLTVEPASFRPTRYPEQNDVRCAAIPSLAMPRESRNWRISRL